MTIRLVDQGWDREVDQAIALDAVPIQIVSPFIKSGTVSRFLRCNHTKMRVVTRFNLNDMAAGVSDISALRRLLVAGAEVRGIKNLHSKLYLFGSSRVIVTSANMTEAGLLRNHEFGFVSENADVIAECSRYFEDLWRRGSGNLTNKELDSWEEALTSYRAAGGRPSQSDGLGDFGADARFPQDSQANEFLSASEATQAFVKFLGVSSKRVPLSYPVVEEIQRAGCHWALAYPAAKRPRSVKEGALMFIGRLTKEPNDIRIFGRAFGMRHVPGRDDATESDIADRDWKSIWPRYVRVYKARFVAGTMSNGVSMTEMMSALGADCFASTKRNAAAGIGNVVPHKAYGQQAAVELSAEGQAWLAQKLQAAFESHGVIPHAELAGLDWPSVPDLQHGPG